MIDQFFVEVGFFDDFLCPGMFFGNVLEDAGCHELDLWEFAPDEFVEMAPLAGFEVFFGVVELLDGCCG